MTEEATPGYDCLTCGACCASPSPGEAYVRLDDADIDRLRGTSLPILEIVVQDSDPPETQRALPTKVDPRGTRVCVALGGCSGGINACSVYERRPGACRTFEVGGYFCQEARRRFGLPV
jgi:Fe-S-cluster containining protein